MRLDTKLFRPFLVPRTSDRSKIDRRTFEIQIRFRTRVPSIFPGTGIGAIRTARPWTGVGTRENSNVTLKVMTREYYRRGMSRWKTTAYICMRARQMKNCRRAGNGARTVRRNVLIYSRPCAGIMCHTLRYSCRETM